MDQAQEQGLDIARAATALTGGEPVVFPTDTVYGIGVAVNAAAGPSDLFDIKQRDQDKPVAWLVGSPDALREYGSAVPEFAHVLARLFWPGPLTLIVKAGDAVPEAFRAADGTIAMRMPDSETVLSLIEAVGAPLATSSANTSGKGAPKSFDEIDRAIVDRVSCAIRDDGVKSGVASTIIDCTGDHPVVVREGGISIQEINACS